MGFRSGVDLDERFIANPCTWMSFQLTGALQSGLLILSCVPGSLRLPEVATRSHSEHKNINGFFYTCLPLEQQLAR
jgi:hypothetical protein